MIEVFGDAWTLSKGSCLCITTNGFIKRNGEAVMGRGIALQAAKRFPSIPRLLGTSIRTNGNKVSLLGGFGDWYLISFPVKHNWYEKADLKLIKRSVEELSELFAGKRTTVYLPRPGCGNGKLQWEVVKPLIFALPDNFKVVSW